MKSNWKPIIGYERSYEINQNGDVRSLNRVVGGPKGPRFITGKMLKVSSLGQVALSDNGRTISFSIKKLLDRHFPTSTLPDFDSIFQRADEIINHRKEEKERQYGPMGEGMERAAQIASGSTGKHFTAKDMYLCLVALKLSRESYNHKEDNLLDAIAYLGALNNHES